jgi:HAD superfamily hydrolase (TIGR01509 family)
MSRVQFVYFDLGNVLARFDPGRACRNVQQRWAVDPQHVYEAIWTSGLQDRLEHGQLTAEEFAEAARQALGLDRKAAPTEELFDRLSDMFDPIEEMVAIVDAVRLAGVPLGILSNTCHAHWQWLAKQRYAAVLGPFDSVILSYEHGVMKPHPSLYRVAGELAGVSPEAILFFDDRAENVAAAVASGWQAHLFTDAAMAREVLRWSGVLR